MSTITLKGNPLETCGTLPATGAAAPGFTLVKTDLSEINRASFAGKRLVLNIFPSIDTPTCATSVRKFNQQASDMQNTQVICVSADLPFALARFCGAEGIANVTPTSTFRNPEFGQQYGLTMTTGPLKGLLARAVVVLDESGKVLHSELVGEIANEPNYAAALAAL